MPERKGWVSTRRRRWDLGRVREQPSAAPEHDRIGEEPVFVDEPGGDELGYQLMLPVVTMSPPVSDFSAPMSSTLRSTTVRSHSGSCSVLESTYFETPFRVGGDAGREQGLRELGHAGGLRRHVHAEGAVNL